ncbi:hypothetical protein [Niabella ginsengisoli]|uniref:Uncharacterized protein n=1 Tax=Niabella ginsengisoli TaxID=522298 RepID=A0ABS9SNM3_9BACT|nr:hypothetical protein [Niabella ginsengisoli]MCH5599970.1 hypothetical protein [Niabella ginsengisoli]
MERSFENAVNNEYEAFKYSVEQAILRAKAGDKGPLQQVLKNLKQRSEAGKDKTKDPHIPAINKLMKEDVWKEAEALLEK